MRAAALADTLRKETLLEPSLRLAGLYYRRLRAWTQLAVACVEELPQACDATIGETAGVM